MTNDTDLVKDDRGGKMSEACRRIARLRMKFIEHQLSTAVKTHDDIDDTEDIDNNKQPVSVRMPRPNAL